ncbi:MAG TPA: hypothetical protein PLY85_11640 [Anaerolineaceae bacterium]|nr:hypothetical protein [Anaerolineaceae bacterium]
MIKKILLGITFTALAGGLIYGGVNRTLAQTIDKEPVTQLLRLEKDLNNQERLEENLEIKQGVGIGNGSTGQGLGTGNDNDSGGYGNGSDKEGYEQSGDGVPFGDGVPDAVVDEWVTLQGTVTAVDASLLEVTTSDGKVILVENRAWWFAQEQGLTLAAGDSVSLTGFYDDGVFEAGSITSLATSQTVSLRDADGRPLWSGRGNGSGRND